MARQYGDVYSLKIFSRAVVVLSSITAIREVMDKNSAIVSDRPPSHFAQEVTGGSHMGASRYSEFLPIPENGDASLSSDDQWRRLRRCAREVLTQSASRSHLNIQQAEATQLMYEMLTHPEVRRYASPLFTPRE
jgi:cytochrome P450